MAETITTTPFLTIYNRFMSKITDDMYMEWTEEDTHKDIQNILLSAIPKFEFPRFKLYDYDSELEILNEALEVVSIGVYNCVLSQEEIEILADLMFINWISRQIGTVEVTRMKYASSDFKFTSQANHLGTLLKMKKEFGLTSAHAQKLYNRRKTIDGYIKPNFAGLGGGRYVNN